MAEWFYLLLRGVFAVLIGLAAVLWPRVTITVFVFVFAAYALADGIANLLGAWLRSRVHERAWPPVLHGCTSSGWSS